MEIIKLPTGDIKINYDTIEEKILVNNLVNENKQLKENIKSLKKEIKIIKENEK